MFYEEFIEWKKIWKEVKLKFRGCEKFWWGDNLDIRFYVYRRLKKIHNKKVLELGAGPGILTSALGSDNYVVSIEIDKKAAMCWMKLNGHDKNKKLILGNMFYKRIYKTLGTFDIVLLSHCLPKNDYKSKHQPEELIRIAKNMLKCGGTLILTTPNNLNNYQSKKPYNINDIYYFLSKAGFNIKYFKTWNPWIYLTHVSKFSIISGILLTLIDKVYNGRKGVSMFFEASKNKE